MTTGAELPIAKALAKAALGDSEEKAELLELAKSTPALQAAADTYARRIAVKQALVLKLYRPLGWVFRIRKEYFEDQFAADLAAKVADIPEGDLITPAASVAFPAMEGLAITLDEPDLKEMYLNLLAAATDSRRPQDPHPAFAQIIKELAPDEARLLRTFLPAPHHPLARVKMERAGAFYLLKRNYIEVPEGLTADFEALAVYVDNWVRLGLMDITYDVEAPHQPPAPDPYVWVQQRPDYPKITGEGVVISFDKGLLRVTDFGRRFLRATT